MRKILLYLLLLLLTACGDLFDFQNTVSPYSMAFDRHEYILMVGDTGQINPIFDPETISNMSVYWMSNNPSVATFVDTRLVALAPGETTVTGVSIEYQIYDTCHVSVLPLWAVLDIDGYPYDMVVYANPTLNGQPLTDRQSVAAFCGDEVRGVGEWREWAGIRYMQLRIYSRYNPRSPYSTVNPQDPLYPYDAETDTEQFVFRLCDYETHQVYSLPGTMLFDGEAHGSLSHLYEMRFMK